MQLFLSWSLSVYTLHQVACFMQSLFTNCCRQNGESWQWRHYHANNITTFFPFPAMFYLPCADHVLLVVGDVVTSWPQTKISDWSEVKCIMILAVQNRTCCIPKCYRIEHVLSQSVYHATSKRCMIQSNSTVYTVFFGWWYKYHDTCFTV